jgi:hypothetical protein
VLNREDYNNNVRCHESNNNKKHQGKICFNERQSRQIDAKTHLEAEMNFSQTDPDTFGNLIHNKETPIEAIEGDEGDKEEEMYLEHTPTAAQKLSPKQYAAMIKDFITNKKVVSSESKFCKSVFHNHNPNSNFVSVGRCYRCAGNTNA